MAKAFIELKQRNRKYRISANDISKAYKLTKRVTPPIPPFTLSAKTMLETDD